MGKIGHTERGRQGAGKLAQLALERPTYISVMLTAWR